MASKYYAVKNGRNKGIYRSWDECQKEINGFSNAIYKSFKTKEEAIAYLENNSSDEKKDYTFKTKVVAYVDGSYNKENSEYSFGAVLLVDGKEYHFKKKFEPDEYSIHRNVAGEIRGASFIINYCIKQGYKEMDLVYDYIGIEHFFEGNWKANTNLTKLYNSFANDTLDKIKINFIKVKSHSNDKYNDLVDSLAKEALGIK